MAQVLGMSVADLLAAAKEYASSIHSTSPERIREGTVKEVEEFRAAVRLPDTLEREE